MEVVLSRYNCYRQPRAGHSFAGLHWSQSLCHSEHLVFGPWVPIGREEAESIAFLPRFPGTCRPALVHTSLMSHLLGAETVAGVSLSHFTFLLRPKPSGGPETSLTRPPLHRGHCVICTISGPKCLRDDPWFFFDFHKTAHSSRAFVSIAEFTDGLGVGTREVYIKATQCHPLSENVFAP